MGDQLARASGVKQIDTRQVHRVGPLTLQFGLQCQRVVLRGMVVQQHVHALPVQDTHDGCAEASGGASDQYHLVL